MSYVVNSYSGVVIFEGSHDECLNYVCKMALKDNFGIYRYWKDEFGVECYDVGHSAIYQIINN